MRHEHFFDALYLEMYDMLLIYAERALDNQHALAEEAVQDTFKICWIKIDEVIASENPKGWLLETLKNVIRNIRRSQARFANLLLVLNKAFTSVEQAAEDETELDITYGDLKDSPDYQLLKEFVLEHRSIKEMAQERGITVDACKKRIQRAKERLKEYFQKNFM